MIVVSDTSPLNYQVLIGQDQVLPSLFGRVVTPPAVLAEMRHAKAPSVVSSWAARPPEWLEVLSPTKFFPIERLGSGESEAIALAQEINADVILIDERDGTEIARELGLNVTGTLNILDYAAARGLLSLPTAIDALRQTTFRMPVELVNLMLDRDRQRSASTPVPPP